MKSTSRWSMVGLALLVVITAGSFYVHENLQKKALHALPHGFKKFSLSDPAPDCARWKEHMPTYRDPDAFHLYIEARKLWRSKRPWMFSREENAGILRDVTSAADRGDWGARALMAHFYLHGLGGLDTNNVLEPVPEKAVAIERLAVKAGQPWGFFDLGVAYEHGYGDVPYDKTLAWAYYLRAAELGSPEAQMALASAYGDARRLVDQKKMHLCAYRQGHGPAAYALATNAKIEGLHREALELHQEGVKFGCGECASALWLLFDDGYWTTANEAVEAFLILLGIHKDAERSSRYHAISAALAINPDLKLSRLDAVVPLPPGKLPKWEGVNDAVAPESKDRPGY